MSLVMKYATILNEGKNMNNDQRLGKVTKRGKPMGHASMQPTENNFPSSLSSQGMTIELIFELSQADLGKGLWAGMSTQVQGQSPAIELALRDAKSVKSGFIKVAETLAAQTLFRLTAPEFIDRLKVDRPIVGVINIIITPKDELTLASVTQYLFDYGYLLAEVEAIGVGVSANEKNQSLWAIRSDLVTNPNALYQGTGGLVAMTSLGNNGRFANQLFQYAFIKMYAMRHNLSCATPQWDGQGLFGRRDLDLPTYPLREVRFYAFDNDDLALWDYADRPLYADFWGYFQELPPCWQPHRAFLRSIFSLQGNLQAEVNAALAQITNDGEHTLVAIHVRRGDFVKAAEDGLEWYRPIPTAAYLAWLRALWPTVKSPVLYVATDDSDNVIREFAEFSPQIATRADSAKLPADVLDFALLRSAAHLAIANSSFSRMAGLLGPDNQSTSLYSLKSGAFEPYNAWEDRSFWEKFAGHEPDPIFKADKQAAMTRGLMARIQRGDALVSLEETKAEANATSERVENLIALTKAQELTFVQQLASLQQKSAQAASAAQLEDLISQTRTQEKRLHEQLLALTKKSEQASNAIETAIEKIEEQLTAQFGDHANAQIALQSNLKDQQLSMEAMEVRLAEGTTQLQDANRAEMRAGMLALEALLTQKNNYIFSQNDALKLQLWQSSQAFESYKAVLEWRIKESQWAVESKIVEHQNTSSVILGNLLTLVYSIQSREDEAKRLAALAREEENKERQLREMRKPVWLLRRLFYRIVLTGLGLIGLLTDWVNLGWRTWLGHLKMLLRTRQYGIFRQALRHPRRSLLQARLAESEEPLTVLVSAIPADLAVPEPCEEDTAELFPVFKRVGPQNSILSEPSVIDYGEAISSLNAPLAKRFDVPAHDKDSGSEVENQKPISLDNTVASGLAPVLAAKSDEEPNAQPSYENGHIGSTTIIDADTQVLSPENIVVEHGLGAQNRKLHDAPSVSVIIPCYNYGRFLEDCVGSVLDQTLKNVEIIIVDNGSTEQLTIEVVERFKSDGRVKVIQLNPNIGLPGARNVGIGAAQAKFVCCIDADDMFELTYLEKALALFQTDTSLGFVYPWARVFGEEQHIWHTLDFDPLQARVDNRTTVCGLYRKTDWQLCGRFNPDMHGGYDDWEFWIRLSMLGRRGRAIKEPLFLHRKHKSNMTNSAALTREAWLEKMRTLAPRFYSDEVLAARLGSLKGRPEYAVNFDKIHSTRDKTQSAKPHMLVIAPWLPKGGGAEALLFQQLEHFKETWRISIVTTVPADNDMTHEFQTITPEIYHLPQIFDEKNWSGFIEHVIQDRGTRLVFSSGSQFHYANVGILRERFPNVDFIDLLHNDVPYGHIAAAINASANIDLHLAISGKIRNSLVEGSVSEGKISVVENGVDTEGLFQPDVVDLADARKKLGVTDAKTVLTFVGRFSDEKRPLAFLDIVEALQDVPGLMAIMVGDGGLAPAVNARLGPQFPVPVLRFEQLSHYELAEVYVATDMLVMTSTIEGQPFVLLEALATGCPAACTEVGDIPRIITEGKNGFLASPDDPLQLAEKIRNWALKPKTKSAFRKAARNSILQANLTHGAMLEGYDKAISSVLKRA